jgi:hypothetical protein
MVARHAGHAKTMTAEAYATRLQRANPELFAADSIKLCPTELLRHIIFAYEAGRDDLRAELRQAAGVPDDLPPGFDSLFGRR